MKNLILLLLLVSCSTVKDLYTDVMTPEKDEPATAKPAEAKVEEKPAPIKPTVTYEDEVSKNWDYQRQIGSYVAITNSTDKKANLVIVRDTATRFNVGVQSVGTTMKYSEGHSVEIKIDDKFKPMRVEPTTGDSIRFVDSLDFVQSIKGKKTLEVNVLNEKGPQKFIFNISGLQDFFTTI